MEQCGSTVEEYGCYVEEYGCYVKQCGCNVDPPYLHISQFDQAISS